MIVERWGRSGANPFACRKPLHRGGFRAAAIALLGAWLLLSALPARAQEWTYRVRPGDTIWDLSGEYLRPGIAWQQLQAHNGVADPYRLAPGSALRFPLSWLLVRPAKARVVAVHGAATARDPGSGVRPVSAGMELDMGTVLVTPADANLTLEFADGSRLQLLGDSELHLDRLSLYGKGRMVDTHLRLQRGRIHNQVNRSRDGGASFIVDTPSATSSVRGTRFRVGAEATHSQTEVLSGAVAVDRGRHRRQVAAGYGVIVADGQAGTIRAVRLLPAPDLSGLTRAPVAPGAALAWPATEHATGYRVQISAEPAFEALLLDAPVPAAQVRVPELPDGRYHLRVSPIDVTGLVGDETVAAFDVEALPLPPYSIAPEQGALVREPQPVFHWSRSQQAAAYRFQLADRPDFENPLHSARLTGNRYGLPQGLAPGRYYWRIASSGADGREGPYGDPVGFELVPEVTRIDIADDAVGRSSRAVAFRWQSSGEGVRYRFQMSRTPDFRRLRVDEVVDQPGISLPRLGAGLWYLRAQAIGRDGIEGPPAPTQTVDIPCRVCQAVVGGGALLILLAL